MAEGGAEELFGWVWYTVVEIDALGRKSILASNKRLWGKRCDLDFAMDWAGVGVPAFWAWLDGYEANLMGLELQSCVVPWESSGSFPDLDFGSANFTFREHRLANNKKGDRIYLKI